MTASRGSVGSAVEGAFRYGVLAAAIAGLTGIGWLYLSETLSPIAAAYTLFALFPVYLVFVASILSVWLGEDKDATDLRPVSR
ncbi:MAG: hypothetical protein ABEI80_09870 [Haloplanus sp.]